MTERISSELNILRHEFPNLEYKEDGLWVYIPEYKMPKDIWNRDETAICFQIPVAYPGEAPYAFYVEESLVIKDTGEVMNNSEPTTTPFDGTWRKVSWVHNDSWRATDDPITGSNLLNFTRSFYQRFIEGK